MHIYHWFNFGVAALCLFWAIPAVLFGKPPKFIDRLGFVAGIVNILISLRP